MKILFDRLKARKMKIVYGRHGRGRVVADTGTEDDLLGGSILLLFVGGDNLATQNLRSKVNIASKMKF